MIRVGDALELAANSNNGVTRCNCVHMEKGETSTNCKRVHKIKQKMQDRLESCASCPN